MKIEKIFSMILTLFFLSFYAMTRGFTALSGALFCFSVFVFLVTFEQFKKPTERTQINDADITNLEAKIELQNKAISLIEDRLGRAEMALGFKKANPDREME